MQTLHQGHSHEHNHEHPHAQENAPRTEGRVIHYARLYDPLVWLMARGQTRALRTLPLDIASLRPGERVLDVGCGTGDLALAAAKRVGLQGAVCGIDASPEMIDVASRKARSIAGSVGLAQFKVEPVEALSFPDESFDVVLSSLMMHHLPGDLKRRALAEIRRVLRSGGRLVIVDLQATTKQPRPWEPGWLIMNRHGMHSVTEAQVRTGQHTLAQLLREAGFEAVDVGTTRYPWIVYAKAQVPV
jgi:demethylmenaquinone methyltransferase/2-methoxy-6-polyprenyl-1,4-benzoquinol methylase/phosphoethanolamine N-methyltransferase